MVIEQMFLSIHQETAMGWSQVFVDNSVLALSVVCLLFCLIQVRWYARRLKEEAELIGRKTLDSPPERVIVAAANRYENGLILVGVRHWDNHMHVQALSYKDSGILPSTKDPVQGFLDNKGHFLNRKQARIIAEKAGQIIKRVGGDEEDLYSENLY